MPDNDFLKDNVWYFLLGVVLIVSFFFTADVMVQEELIFGDDGFYAARGQAFAENLEVSRTVFGETDVRGHRPLTREPMTFILLSFFYMVAGEVGMKLLVPLVSIVSASLLFLLVKEMHSVRAGFFAALFYLAIPAIVTHTVFLYVEHIALMYLIGSFYFLYKYLQGQNYIHLILTGVLFGLSALTAQNVVIVPIIFAIVLYVYKIDWKGWFKEFGTIVLVALILMGPWMAHNYNVGNGLGFDSHRVLEPLGINLRDDTDYTEQLPDFDEDRDLTEEHREGQRIHEMGYINYIEFAYTLPIFIIALLGFSFYFVEKKNKYYIPILWTVFMFAVIYTLLWDGSFDAMSRNTLYIVAPIAMAAGYATDRLYDYLTRFKTAGKSLALIFAILILTLSLYSVHTKAEELRPQKQYSQSFFQACNWIDQNTPQDSVVHYIYHHRANYHCQRKATSNARYGLEDAIISADEKSYEAFQTIGVDYIMLHNQLIDMEPRRTAYSIDFVQYVMMDPNYEQVYEYPQGCNVLDMQTDCVAVYEILDEDEAEEDEQIMLDPDDMEPEDDDEAPGLELA